MEDQNGQKLLFYDCQIKGNCYRRGPSSQVTMDNQI